MPYNPGVNDRSGEILAQGITAAADKLSQSFNERTQVESESQGADLSLQMLADQGYLDHDTYVKARGGSLSQKKAALGGVVAQQAMQSRQTAEGQANQRINLEGQRVGLEGQRLQQDQMQSDASNQINWAQYGLDAQKSEADNQTFAPSPEALQQYNAAGYAYLPQSKNGGSAVPLPRAGADAALPGATQTLPNGTQIYFDGKSWKPLPTAKTMKSSEAQSYGAAEEELTALQQQISDEQKAIEAGDNRGGFMGVGYNRADKLKELTPKLAGLQAKMGAMEGPKAAANAADSMASPAQEAESVRAQAKAAIAGGKNRQMVLDRLKQMGVDTTGI